MLKKLDLHWAGPGGCKAVLLVAWPLIISHGAHTLQMFIDSVFLMKSSRDEMAAASLAGIIHFACVCFFFGVSGYVSTFVAQYTGSKRPERVGPSVWQGIYFTLAAALACWLFIPFAQPLFQLIGHGEKLAQLEKDYFVILTFAAAGPAIMCQTLSSFFSGRSKTLVVMLISMIDAGLNIIFDYIMIFGKLGLPAMGIKGAAWATAIAHTIAMCLYFILVFQNRYRHQFNTLGGWRFDKELFKRLLRYGGPSGLHFMLDIMAFSIFCVFVGRIGPVEMAASNMAFRINMLAFMPMIGFGMAVSVLTGQALGDNKPQWACRATVSAACMTFTYMFIVAIGYWFFPDIFLFPFKPASNADPLAIQEFQQMYPVAVKLLGFVAIYSLFDGGNIIFSSTLKGAGDTFFVMLWGITLSWLIMVIPSLIFVHYKIGPGNGLYSSWAALALYIAALAMLFFFRYRHGKWQSMRVTEPTIEMNMNLPEVPAVDAET